MGTADEETPPIIAALIPNVSFCHPYNGLTLQTLIAGHELRSVAPEKAQAKIPAAGRLDGRNALAA